MTIDTDKYDIRITPQTKPAKYCRRWNVVVTNTEQDIVVCYRAGFPDFYSAFLNVEADIKAGVFV